MSESCKKCDNKAGLSILLVRPSAIAVDEAFAPNQAAQLLTHPAFGPGQTLPTALGLAPLQKSRYALRMLRKGGYVYVFYTQRPPQFVKPWQAFKVHDSGALIPEGAFLLGDESSHFACSKKPDTHPNDVRTLCIQLPHDEPSRAQPVWIGFSMNWWDDTVRARVQENLAGAGMVRIDPLQPLGGVTHAFKAEAGAVQTYVADFALRSLNHGGVKRGLNLTEGGTPSATPFYNRAEDKTYGQAQGLVEVMQTQSQGHALTQGRHFVLAIADPVGLAADLNGIRMARDQAFKDALRVSSQAWPGMSHASLNLLQAAMNAAGVMRAEAEAYGQAVSRTQWELLLAQPYYQMGFAWQASADASLAADGSPSGRLLEPGNARRIQRIAQRGKLLGNSEWQRVADQIDQKKRSDWQRERNAALSQEAGTLSDYENEWLAAMKAQPVLDYFANHFPENASHSLNAPVKSGVIYARESSLIHFPQPLSTQQCSRAYVAHTLDKAITDKAAIALRALVGNDKQAIEQVHEALVGEWSRSGDNLRDKTYDLIKGLLTTEAGLKLNWMTPVLAAFSMGQVAAMAAAVSQLVVTPEDLPKAERYLQKLPKVLLAQHAVEAALTATLAKGARLSMPLLLELKVSSKQALAIMAGSKAAVSAANWVVHAGDDHNVRLWVLTSLDEFEHIRDAAQAGSAGNAGKAGAAPGPRPVASAGNALAELQLRAKSVNAQPLNAHQAHQLLKHQNERLTALAREKTANLRFAGSTQRRLAIGSLVVQSIGMVWAVKGLMASWSDDSPAVRQKRYEAWLSVGDGGSGMVAAAFEWSHAGNSLRLVGQGGAAAAGASVLLPMLELGAAIAGVAGGVVNMMICWDKAKSANEKGDIYAGYFYATASVSFLGTAITSATLAVDTGAQAALKRFAGRRAVVLIAGSIVGGMEATVAGVAVASLVSGLGIVLLGAGIVTMLVAMHELDALEKWANRSYFGKGDRAPKFTNSTEEQMLLEATVSPAPPAPPLVSEPPGPTGEETKPAIVYPQFGGMKPRAQP